MQLMGGYGYSSEYDMERLVRATLVSTIYGGTSEIQRTIIAKTLGLYVGPQHWGRQTPRRDHAAAERYSSVQPRASARGFLL
jgi:hypothetical protein